MAANPERAERSAATIRRGMTRLQRRLRVEGPADGLAPAKLSALGILRRAERPMTPGELAGAEGVQPQSMTRVLAELEASGFVTRVRDQADARQFHITLTDAGDAALAVDVHERDVWLARAMVLELSPAERKVLVLAADLMERVADLDRSLSAESATPAVAVPILPMRDAATTVAFYERLGFANSRGSDDGYVMLVRDGLELHLSRTPELDPFTGASIAFLSVPDADAFRAEVLAAGVVEARHAHDRSAQLRRRWEDTHDVSRVGSIEDKPWRVREFALFDPTNNLLRVGHPIGLNRRRRSRSVA